MSGVNKPPFDFGILSKADIRLTIIFFFILRPVSVLQHLYDTFFHMPDTVRKAQSKAKTVYQIRIGSTVNFHVKKKIQDV